MSIKYTKCVLILTMVVNADDISEEKLKALWVQTHTSPANQTDESNMSHDSTSPDEPIQETRQGEDDNGETGQREGETTEDENRETGQGEGESQEVNGDREEAEGNLENGEQGEEDDAGKEEEATGIQKENQRDGVTEGGNENAETEGVTVGFLDEPFVQAATQFQHYELTGILDLLTQSIEKGTCVHVFAHAHLHVCVVYCDHVNCTCTCTCTYCFFFQVTMYSSLMPCCCVVLSMLCGEWKMRLSKIYKMLSIHKDYQMRYKFYIVNMSRHYTVKFFLECMSYSRKYSWGRGGVQFYYLCKVTKIATHKFKIHIW